MDSAPTYTAFLGTSLVATGPLEHTVRRVKRRLDRGATEPLLVFEDLTGVQVDFDWRGSPEDVVARLAHHPYLARGTTEAAPVRSGPGRPRLGVVSREVSLLPRHWAWLGEQPGGSSAALRRLVDEARRRDAGAGEARRARDAASKFLWSMAGDLPGFEDVTRALFAGDLQRVRKLTARWPSGVRAHLERLVAPMRERTQASVASEAR
jgi:hypothetical protein